MSSPGESKELKSEVISSSNQTNTNTMEPTENDVLSGLGAWLNQHPGNERFRKIIDQQKVRKSQRFPTHHTVDMYTYRLTFIDLLSSLTCPLID